MIATPYPITVPKSPAGATSRPAMMVGTPKRPAVRP
jgi:hypothetical protein